MEVSMASKKEATIVICFAKKVIVYLCILLSPTIFFIVILY